MNILKKFLLFNKKTENNKSFHQGEVDKYKEIGNLVKEARIQKKYDYSRIIHYV